MDQSVEALIHSLTGDLKPVERLSSPWLRFARWMLAAALCVGIGLTVFGTRKDLPLRLQEPAFLLQTLLQILAAVTAGASAFLLSVPGLERNRWALFSPLLPLALWIAILVDGMLREEGGTYFHWDYLCAGDLLLFGLVPSVILLLLIRRAAPLRLGMNSAMALLAAFSLGALGSTFSCHSDQPSHLLFWHLAPTLLLGGLGLLFGKWLLSRRR